MTNTETNNKTGIWFETISEAQQKADFKGYWHYTIKEPRRATKGSAGYDCFAPFDLTLRPNEEMTIPTGIRIHMNEGNVMLAFPRSGLGFKYYCRLANTIGVIDEDYYYSDNEGHIFIKLRNEGNKAMHIAEGEAMCQFIIMNYLLTDNDADTVGGTRNGGFGSTTGK